MDSIYDVPRTAPVPTSAQKIPATPVVPEVSMIFQNNVKGSCPPGDSMYLSYNAWKARNQTDTGNVANHNYYMNFPRHQETKGSTGCANPQSTSRRQVRFESPVLVQQHQQQQLPCVSSKNVTSAQSNNRHFSNPLQSSNIQNCNNASLPVQPNKFAKPFEQIYMANVPNRHLDLSIIDAPKQVVGCKENIENVSPNVNLSSNRVHFKQNQNVEQAVRICKNTPDYFRDLTNSKTSTVNNESKGNGYQHPQKIDDWFPGPNKLKEGMSSNSEKLKKLDASGMTEKNRIVDLYNYNRDSLESHPSDYAHRHAFDNAKLVENYKTVGADTSHNHLCPAANVYDSFTSHSCASNKCSCQCVDRKSHENTKCNAALQTGVAGVSSPYGNVDSNKSNNDPTVTDLLKIIQQQNEQLLILQKQVAALINNRDAPKPIEAAPLINRNLNVFGDQYRTSTQLEAQDGLCNSAQTFLPKKGPLQQFSMDVMTSFEVSIRRPPHLNVACKKLNHQPKICEITETDSNAFDHSLNSAAANPVGNVLDGICKVNRASNDTLKNTDVSLTFNEPVQVRQACPSPVNSVEIHMNDYSFDSDQEDAAEGGWTFYNNMMHQVNNILKKSGIQPSNSPPINLSEVPQNLDKQNMMKKVKEATIKHLKSIGVHVPAMDDAGDSVEFDSTNRLGRNQNEVSFAVKQLLMKYLPDEQLAKIAYMQRENAPPTEKPGLIKRRPEFSFATVQYMQKYNLLNDATNGYKGNNQPPVVQQNEEFDRILDVTAIRQQPKLL